MTPEQISEWDETSNETNEEFMARVREENAKTKIVYTPNGEDDQNVEEVEVKNLPVKDEYIESLSDLLAELKATKQSLQDANDAIEEVIKSL